mmetsp:Transcript_23466/g.32045  ORF Transcript_23466/g.32045 Transcript_23466/m.32045 type:complete len:205 (+) Transcript_23466:231-845(+)
MMPGEQSLPPGCHSCPPAQKIFSHKPVCRRVPCLPAPHLLFHSSCSKTVYSRVEIPDCFPCLHLRLCCYHPQDWQVFLHCCGLRLYLRLKKYWRVCLRLSLLWTCSALMHYFPCHHHQKISPIRHGPHRLNPFGKPLHGLLISSPDCRHCLDLRGCDLQSCLCLSFCRHQNFHAYLSAARVQSIGHLLFHDLRICRSDQQLRSP